MNIQIIGLGKDLRIFIRDSDSKKWKFAETIRAKAESELQKLLVESPSLITIDEIREGVAPLVFAVSEFGVPGFGLNGCLGFQFARSHRNNRMQTRRARLNGQNGDGPEFKLSDLGKCERTKVRTRSSASKSH